MYAQESSTVATEFVSGIQFGDALSVRDLAEAEAAPETLVAVGKMLV